MNKLTDAELAYIAGIIDGEGCINLNPGTFVNKRPCFRTKIVVVTTDIIICPWLYNKTGIGTLRIQKRNQKNRRSDYTWTLIKKEDKKEFLESILPFLTLKKEQAEIVLKFIEFSVGTGCLNRHLEFQTKLYEQMRDAKTKYLLK